MQETYSYMLKSVVLRRSFTYSFLAVFRQSLHKIHILWTPPQEDKM